MRRVAAGAAAALLATVTTGCEQNDPGVAADVAGDQITDQQVDDFSEVLCSLSTGTPQQGGQAPQPVPTKQLRVASLRYLLGNELASKVIDPGALDQKQVSQTASSYSAGREVLPASQQGTFDSFVEKYAEAQVGLTELGRESLEAKGKQDVSDERAFAEGDRLRTRYAQRADVSVDPRFGTMVDGVLQPSDGSLSVPVSETAKAAAAPDASADGLPANLVCS